MMLNPIRFSSTRLMEDGFDQGSVIITNLKQERQMKNKRCRLHEILTNVEEETAGLILVYILFAEMYRASKQSVIADPTFPLPYKQSNVMIL